MAARFTPVFAQQTPGYGMTLTLQSPSMGTVNLTSANNGKPENNILMQPGEDHRWNTTFANLDISDGAVLTSSDGFTAGLTVPVVHHSYPIAGTYTVTVKPQKGALDISGATDADNIVLVVYIIAPIATSTPWTVVAESGKTVSIIPGWTPNDTASFEIYPYAPSDMTTKFIRTRGQAALVIPFNAAGRYTPKINFINPYGILIGTAISNEVIVTYANPAITISNDHPEVNQQTRVTLSATGLLLNPGDSVFFDWEVDDGIVHTENTSAQPNPLVFTPTFTATNVISLSARLEGSFNGKSYVLAQTAAKQITVVPVPVITPTLSLALNKSSVQVGEMVDFTLVATHVPQNGTRIMVGLPGSTDLYNPIDDLNGGVSKVWNGDTVTVKFSRSIASAGSYSISARLDTLESSTWHDGVANAQAPVTVVAVPVPEVPTGKLVGKTFWYGDEVPGFSLDTTNYTHKTGDVITWIGPWGLYDSSLAATPFALTMPCKDQWSGMIIVNVVRDGKTIISAQLTDVKLGQLHRVNLPMVARP